MTPQPMPDIASLLSDRRWLAGLARGLIAGDPLLDDVLQETRLRAWRHPPTDSSTAGAWVRRVASNWLRRAHASDVARRDREHKVARHEAVPATDDLAARVEVQRAVAEAVLRLEEPYRSAILLRFFEELPPRAIAARTNAPVETVRTRLKRGLAELREDLDRRYGSRDTWSVVVATKLVWKGGAIAMSAGTKACVGAAAAILLAVVAWNVETRMRTREPRAAVIAEVVAPLDASSASAQATDPSALGSERQRVSAPSTAPIRFERARIFGRVLDGETQRPVADALVRIEYYGRDRKPIDLETRSGPDGAFETIIERVTVNYCTGSVAHPEYATEPIQARVLQPSEGDDGVADLGAILLYRGTLVSGRVVELPDRMPVAGAELYIRDAMVTRANEFGPNEARHCGRTRANGSFELDRRVRVAHGPLALLAVARSHIGFVLLAPERSRERLDDLEVAIEPPGSLDVRVLDDQSAPVAGVKLIAYPVFPPFGQSDYGADNSPRPWIHDEPWSSIFLATTGADGRARFEALPEGRSDPLFEYQVANPKSYRVHAVAEGWPDARESASIARGEQTAVEIKLRRAGMSRVFGRVIDDAGQPIAGALVRAKGFADVRTDADGRYATASKNGRLGSLDMHVSADGFAPDEFGATHKWSRANVSVKEGDGSSAPVEELERDFTLARAQTVRGKILDDTRAPLANVVVHAKGLNRARTNWIELEAVGGATSADGSFFIEGIAIDTLSLEVEPPDGFLNPFPVRIVPGDQNLVVVLVRRPPATATAIAAVVDADTGAVLDPMHAYARPLSTGAHSFPGAKCTPGQVIADKLFVGRWEMVVTLNDGRRGRAPFEVTKPDETVRLKVAISARPSAIVEGSVFVGDEPLTGQPKRWFIWVRPSSNSSEDSGHALDIDGRPVSELTDGCAVADENGRFRVGRLPSGLPIRFVVDENDRYAEATVVLEPGESRRIELHLAPPAGVKWMQSQALSAGRLIVETARGNEPLSRLFAVPTGTIGTVLAEERMPAGHVRWRAELTSSTEYPPHVRVATGDIEVVSGETPIVDVLGFE